MIDVIMYILRQLHALCFGLTTMMCLPVHLFFPHPLFFFYVFLRGKLYGMKNEKVQQVVYLNFSITTGRVCYEFCQSCLPQVIVIYENTIEVIATNDTRTCQVSCSETVCYCFMYARAPYSPCRPINIHSQFNSKNIYYRIYVLCFSPYMYYTYEINSC